MIKLGSNFANVDSVASFAIYALVKNGSYFGVTILRIEDVTGENLFAKKKFKKMIKAFKN